MDCFVDLIGISETCTAQTPTSGLFLDRVGIGLEELEAYFNKPFVNGEDFANKQMIFAGDIVSREINNHFQSKYRTNSILEGQRIGISQENLVLQNAVPGFSKGICIELCNTTSFVDVFVSDIDIQVDFTGSVNVEVWDIYQDKLLDTIVVEAIAGEVVRTPVSKTYQSRRKNLKIAFLYDSAFQSYKTNLRNGGCSSCGARNGVQINKFIRTNGAIVDNALPKIQSNLRGSADTGGLSIIYNVNCNHSEWLCANKNQIALPFLYKTAFLITQYALDNSNQFNTSVVIDRGKLESAVQKHEDQYNEQMADLLTHMKLPDDSVCFQCKRVTKMKITIP